MQMGTIIGDIPYHVYYVIYSADVPDYSWYQSLIDQFVLPSFEIRINSTNRLAATENFEVPAEQELWLNNRVIKQVSV